MIAYEDFKYRMVHMLSFGSLLFFKSTLCYIEPFSFSFFDFSIILLFILVQIIFLTIYFSIKSKRFENIFDKYFGIGDLVFFCITSLFFSIYEYMLFFVFTLLITVLFVLIIRLIKKTKEKNIPLAGAQALMLMIVLMFKDTLLFFKIN